MFTEIIGFKAITVYKSCMTHTKISPKARWPWGLVLVTAFTGALLTGLIGVRVGAREAEEATEQFRMEASRLRQQVERELTLFVDVLYSIRALHGLSGEISAEALEEFVERGMIHQQVVLGAFGFAQRITHPLRLALEDAHRESPERGYRILQRTVDGRFVTAPSQPLYFPLTWQQATEALQVPIGYDFASRPDGRTAIDRMQQMRKAVLVEQAVLPDAPDPAHWVFAPIYLPRPDGGDGPLVGFAVGLWRPLHMLSRVSAQGVPSPGLEMGLIPGLLDDDAATPVHQSDGTWWYRYPVQVVDTPWTFTCQMPVYVPHHQTAAVWIAGLLITALVTSQLVLVAGRSQRIEGEVALRTEELRQAKERLEEQIHERVRLEEEMSAIAMRERQKLGRDLHDSVGQKLTGAVFLSRSLLQHLQQQDGYQAEHAATLNETLKSSVGQVRALARGLAPVSLNDETLNDALNELAEEMTDLYGISCELISRADDDGLDAKIKEQLYLIAREAANNAARHSGARAITIAWKRPTNGGFDLAVEDDGQGFVPQEDAGDGMGLRILRHRAKLIQATLVWEPGASGGTRVHCFSEGTPS